MHNDAKTRRYGIAALILSLCSLLWHIPVLALANPGTGSEFEVWMLDLLGWLGYALGSALSGFIFLYLPLAGLLATIVINRIYILRKVKDSQYRSLIGASVILGTLLIFIVLFTVLKAMAGV